LFTATGEDQYAALILRTLVLAGVLAAGTWVMYGTIRKSTPQERPAGAGRQPDTGYDKKDSN
ncbi:MAG TPA: hypothetical protein VLL74_07010, partial [Methanoregula sp.]|nr:hypothetical protein [Methanoregula sp.]